MTFSDDAEHRKTPILRESITTLHVTHRLPDGREIESEVEQRGSRIRLRARICRDGLVQSACRVTGTITELMLRRDRDLLPAEFARNPAIQRAVFDPLEEIWNTRLRFRGLGG